MLYIFLVLVILIIITKIIYTEYSTKQLLELTKDEELDNIVSNLPSNLEVCKDILKRLDNENVQIDFSQDEKSTTSFYNVFSNKIILANSEKANKSFARFMFVSHECWHSVQNKKYLWYNFILANINILYLAVTLLLSVFNILNKEMYLIMFGIYAILNMFVLFARNVIESDATYMAYVTAKEYLNEIIEVNTAKKLTDKYKEILGKGTTNFLFSLITSNFVMLIGYMLIGLIRGWW